MIIRKGTFCFINDEGNQPTNQSISMDKDRDLKVGDIFTWNEDLKPRLHTKMKVVAFADFMPILIDAEPQQ